MTRRSKADAVLKRVWLENLKALAIIVGLMVIVLTPFILFQRCGKNGAAARRELEQRGIVFNEKAFLERVKHGELEIVKLFLTAGVNPDARDENGDTALMTAIAANYGEVAGAVLSAGADVNARTRNGSTTLHLMHSGETNRSPSCC